ncbi:hypothetical protein BJX64DRAFT_265647, partial [Aspergillus heterothallicus]
MWNLGKFSGAHSLERPFGFVILTHFTLATMVLSLSAVRDRTRAPSPRPNNIESTQACMIQSRASPANSPNCPIWLGQI